MMDRLINSMKAHAAAQANALGQPRFGIVTSYNPNDGTAKVQIQPEGVLTGWLPVLAQSVGAGWGLHAPLATGEQVLILPQDGDALHGVIVGRAWSDQMRPPAAASGEMVMRHASGSQIHLVADGTVVINDASGSTITMANNGTIAVSGVLSVTGQIKVNNVVLAVP